MIVGLIVDIRGGKNGDEILAANVDASLWKVENKTQILLLKKFNVWIITLF